MSASEVLQKVLWFTRKKSSLQWTSGVLRRHVNLEESGFNTLQASIKSKLSQKVLITSKDFLWVLARPPFLSFPTSRTRLKSPPMVISSQLKSNRWLKKELKKSGSSSFGAYMFARVRILPLVIKSHIMKRPRDLNKFWRFERRNCY